MNGDDSRYFDMKFDSLVKLFDERMAVQNERHAENKKDLIAIKEHMCCDVHGEKIKTLFSDTKKLWVCFWFLITVPVVGSIVWIARGVILK